MLMSGLLYLVYTKTCVYAAERNFAAKIIINVP